MRVAFYTIGCKLNQFETEYMMEQFKKAGCKVVSFKEEADVYIVNTCTVTSQADAKSRQSVRQALKRNPEALVVAVGCYSQVSKESLLEAGAHLVVGNAEKTRIVELVKSHLEEKRPKAVVSEPNNHFTPMPIEDFSGYSRAFIKVQEGCNRRCSYCIVWKARGPARSATIDFVLNEARKLSEAGFEEIVLTGTHLGSFGQERGESLLGLLEELVKIPSVKKIRLSSLEPTEITDELLEFMASCPKIARHLHIPLQSGSNRILKLMNRPYTSEQFEELILNIHRKMPEAGIGVDVIVGFPTETEEDFEATYSLIERLPIYYMHIFSYSPRPGTPAASMKPQVRPDIKRQRWEMLNRLKAEKKGRFIESMIGKVVDGVIEGRPAEEGYWRGLTENYIPVLIPGNLKHLTGKVYPMRLTERAGEEALAELICHRCSSGISA